MRSTSESTFEDCFDESLRFTVSGEDAWDDFLDFTGSLSISWLLVAEAPDAPEAASLGVDVGDNEDDVGDDVEDDVRCSVVVVAVVGSGFLGKSGFSANLTFESVETHIRIPRMEAVKDESKLLGNSETSCVASLGKSCVVTSVKDCMCVVISARRS